MSTSAWETHRLQERIESARRLAATLGRPNLPDLWEIADWLEREIATEGHASIGTTLLAVAMLRAVSNPDDARATGTTPEGEGA